MCQTKTCRDCKETKPVTEFYKSGTGNRLQSYCKLCNSKRASASYKRIYQKNPDLKKSRNLRNRYGITLDQYNQLLHRQNRCCRICGTHEDLEGKSLAVDHCHSSGKIRGLLCSNCNTALGKVRDNVVILHSMIHYLQAA
ncbi:recombination endonuclease VII [Spirosoma oryzae]|uniref:Recombination endonuclease VII n=1 Tax=Spirosoma oryzae TaxID=1469603 RepID=A0A2T0SYC0_9BACT|nr:recombination endonuclease VII [Spirosoma oryzae]